MLHNIQQLSDAVEELQAQSGKSNEREASFIVAQVQPLAAAIAKLQADVAEIKTQVAAIVGAPPKP